MKQTFCTLSNLNLFLRWSQVIYFHYENQAKGTGEPEYYAVPASELPVAINQA